MLAFSFGEFGTHLHPLQSQRSALLRAQELEFALGLSGEVHGSVVDLCTPTRKAFAKACGHLAVLQWVTTGTQTCLQGHRNAVRALAAPPDKSVLATADAGEGSFIALWDVDRAEAIWVLEPPQPSGVRALAFGETGHFLAALSAGGHGDSVHQELTLFELQHLSEGQGEMIARSEVPSGDEMFSLDVKTGHERSHAQVVTIGPRKVHFWTSHAADSEPSEGRFGCTTPKVSARDFRQPIGKYTSCCFFHDGHLAAAGTVGGDVIIFEPHKGPTQLLSEARHATPTWIATRMVRVHSYGAVNALSGQAPGYLATGGEDGCVRFYDDTMRIAVWFDDIAQGPITSLSFSSEPYEEALTSPGARLAFTAPPFTIGTSRGKVARLSPSEFDDPMGGRPKPEVNGAHGNCNALTCHPLRMELATGGSAKVVWFWDARAGGVRSTVDLPQEVSSLEYSPSGDLLAIGMAAPPLVIVRTDTLDRTCEVRFSNAAIRALAFDETGANLAAADEERAVALVCATPEHGEWQYIAKHRAHSGGVTDIAFHGTRLFSCGSDGRVVELDVANSTIENGMALINEARPSEGTSVNAIASIAPSSQSDFNCPEGTLVAADDAFKMHILDAATLTTLRTVLGPLYAGPVTQLCPIRDVGGSGGVILAYATDEQVVGTVTHPHDGNPCRTVGLIAHPGRIAGLARAPGGQRTIFTARKEEATLAGWRIDADALQRQGEEEGFPGMLDTLLEGGKDGQEMELAQDLFSYCKLAHEGEGFSGPRSKAHGIPMSWLPAFSRAMGYFPSQGQEEAMLADAERDSGIEYPPHGVESEPTLPLQTALKLHLNHREVDSQKATREDVAWAMEELCGSSNPPREVLADALMSHGEPMSGEELSECLDLVLGESSVEGAFPENVSASFLADHLGLPLSPS